MSKHSNFELPNRHGHDAKSHKRPLFEHPNHNNEQVISTLYRPRHTTNDWVFKNPVVVGVQVGREGLERFRRDIGHINHNRSGKPEVGQWVKHKTPFPQFRS